MAKDTRHMTLDNSSDNSPCNSPDPTSGHTSYNNMAESVNLIIQSHPEELKQVRNLVIDILSKTTISKPKLQLITLAVNEACSNIIKHGYKNDYNQKIKITISLETKTLTITIIDNGIKFDINSIEPRDVNEIKPGGLGLHIMEEVMDRVEHSHTSQNFNKLTMVKNLLS